MVGDTKRQPVITTSVTSYKFLKKTTQKPSGIITCSMLINQLINMFGAVKTWSKLSVLSVNNAESLLKKFIHVTTNMQMSQMHFWLVNCSHKNLITFVAKVVGKICLSKKTQRWKWRYRDKKHILFDKNRENPKAILADFKMSRWFQKFPLNRLSEIIFFSEGGIIL